MTLSTAVIVLCTAPDEQQAEQLADKALSARPPPALPCCPAPPLIMSGRASAKRPVKCKCC